MMTETEHAAHAWRQPSGALPAKVLFMAWRELLPPQILNPCSLPWAGGGRSWAIGTLSFSEWWRRGRRRWSGWPSRWARICPDSPRTQAPRASRFAAGVDPSQRHRALRQAQCV